MVDTKTALFYMSIVVVVALFMILFLQGAFVRYRLQDVETSLRASASDGATTPSGGLNSVRTYALRIASCRMNELNARPHRPLIPRATDFFSASSCRRRSTTAGGVAPTMAKETMAASWLVMRRSSVSEQLRQDVEAGSVKYMIISGIVVQVATVDVALQLGNFNRHARDFTYLLMAEPFDRTAVSDDPSCRVSDIIMPWMTQSSSSKLQSSVRDVSQMVKAYDKCGENSASSDIIVHVWAYGTARS